MDKDDKLQEPSTVIDESLKPYYTDTFSPGETKEQFEVGKQVKGDLSLALSSKADKATTISTIDGIQGGGDLSGNRTLSLTDTAVAPGSYINSNVTVDQKGRITTISNGSVAYPAGVTCWVYTTTATTFVQNTLLSIPFDQERYDTASMHDNVTNNSRITVPSAGYYLVTGTVTFGVNGAGTTASVQLLKNGSTTYDYNRINANPNSGEFCFKICTQIECAASDYFELYIFNDFGGNVTLSTNVGQNTFAALKLAN